MNKQVSTGVGLVPALGLLFIGLKLTGAINWSWWWVLVPFWGMPALMVVVFLIYVFACIATKDKIKWW